jgi:TRAP-type C4-dicarboxylate transport system permease small subunit
MSAQKIVGILLLAAGILALAYGGFSYTKETHEAQLGPLELSVEEKERVNVPVWAGAAAVVAGALLLVLDRKR